uniref:FAST kinase domains 1 n=1 Tax=Leptobrachium leishanense TaxID=445787 RepID=A0A8C5RAK8_9ANUR
MLRCVRRCRFWLRMAQTRCMTTDPLLEQLNTCAGEEQVLQLVGQNEANLSVAHLGCAINLLWQFQKEKPYMMRTVGQIRDHPQFIALRGLTENKINLIDDNTLVEILYIMLRFTVVRHDSLIQQLVVEGWKRLDGLNPVALSKFSVCLTDQYLNESPIMGHIARIVDNNLDDLQDTRILSILMISISVVISPRLRDRLIEKAESLFDTMNVHHLRRVVQFLQITKYHHLPLLDKCTQKLIQDMEHIKPEILCALLGLFQALSFFNYEFQILAKSRLIETIDEYTEPNNFAQCFEFLGPKSGPEIRQRLEEGALKWVDEMSLLHLVYVLQAMEKMGCRNYPLIQKIAKRLPSFLDLYRPNDLAKVAQALRTMHFQTPELFAQLQQVLRSKLKSSCIPSDVAKLAKTLAKLPSHQVDEEIVSKLEAILPQCTLSDVGNLVPAIFKWVQTTPASRRNPSSAPYGNLLKTINGFGIERVQKMDNINVLLDELKPSALPWLEEVLCGDVINTFDRLLDQVTLQNVPDISRFITRAHFFHPRLLNKVASVTTENITKIHHSKIYTILLPFCTLNYEPPQCEEFFDACIQHFLTHLSKQYLFTHSSSYL